MGLKEGLIMLFAAIVALTIVLVLTPLIATMVIYVITGNIIFMFPLGNELVDRVAVGILLLSFFLGFSLDEYDLLGDV